MGTQVNIGAVDNQVAVNVLPAFRKKLPAWVVDIDTPPMVNALSPLVAVMMNRQSVFWNGAVHGEEPAVSV